MVCGVPQAQPKTNDMRLFIYHLLTLALISATPVYFGQAAQGVQASEEQLLFTDRVQELKYYLRKYNLPLDWVRVAKFEAGTKLNSAVAQKANNFFGMHAPRTRETTAIGKHKFYAKYANMEDAVRDLALWSEINPQKEGESFDTWLRRRNWNPYPFYWAYLKRMKV